MRFGRAATTIGASAVLLLAACGDESSTEVKGLQVSPATVNVTLLNDFKIEASPDTVAAGTTTFHVTNKGDDKHEMVLIRTDLAVDRLPTDPTGKADEEGTGVESLGEVEELAQGKAGDLTVSLTKGTYVLVCNITETEADGKVEAHYAEGMRLAFTVT